MDWLIAARFVTGIGLGAEIVIGYATMLEFIPPTYRGRWAALLSLVTNFGLFASTLLSWLIIPVLGWRPMFVIAGLGAFVVLWMRKAMPESPRWLEVQGRAAEAGRDPAWRGGRGRGFRLFAGSRPEPLPAPVRLSSAAFLRPVVVGSIMQVVLGIAIYGFVAWVPTFLVQHGMAINRSLGQSV